MLMMRLIIPNRSKYKTQDAVPAAPLSSHLMHACRTFSSFSIGHVVLLDVVHWSLKVWEHYMCQVLVGVALLRHALSLKHLNSRPYELVVSYCT
jgi:hypothetical protein